MNNKLFIILTIIYAFSFNLYSIDVPSNLIIKDIASGNSNSKIAQDSKLLLVNYTGWLFDQQVETQDYCEAKGKMFDSNTIDKFNHKVPFQFLLGSGVVIKGWDIGLKNMRINDVRCLVIPPKLAYGNRKIGNIIAANSTLIFEVKLLDVIDLNNKEKDK